MSYIILVGAAFAVLCMLLTMAFGDDGSANDKVVQAPAKKAPRQAKAKPKPKAAPRPKTPPKAAPNRTPQKTANDELTRIEGIGPKIAALLSDAGIRSFKQLAALEVDALKRIVTDGGVLFREKVAVTWSEQAKLATNGKWDALTKLQAKMKGGAR